MFTFKDYSIQTNRTRKKLSFADKVTEGCFGLAGESGEVIDVIKKCMFQGHELDKHHLAEEIGDCLWYLDYIADTYGLSLENIAKLNIKKLRERYPEGFEEKLSVNREV